MAKEQADKIARENAIAEGELIPKADVVAGMQAMIAHSRSRLLAIPAKLAPTVSTLETIAEIKEAITDAVHEALDELSRTRGVAERPAQKKGSRRR